MDLPSEMWSHILAFLRERALLYRAVCQAWEVLIYRLLKGQRLVTGDLWLARKLVGEKCQNVELRYATTNGVVPNLPAVQEFHLFLCRQELVWKSAYVPPCLRLENGLVQKWPTQVQKVQLYWCLIQTWEGLTDIPFLTLWGCDFATSCYTGDFLIISAGPQQKSLELINYQSAGASFILRGFEDLTVKGEYEELIIEDCQKVLSEYPTFEYARVVELTLDPPDEVFVKIWGDTTFQKLTLRQTWFDEGCLLGGLLRASVLEVRGLWQWSWCDPSAVQEIDLDLCSLHSCPHIFPAAQKVSGPDLFPHLLGDKFPLWKEKNGPLPSLAETF